MLDAAIEFFKRNPGAKSAHVVLDKCFDNAQQAELYRRAMNAHRVSSYLRSEWEQEAPAADTVKKGKGK